jgi:hypothetical protein
LPEISPWEYINILWDNPLTVDWYKISIELNKDDKYMFYIKQGSKNIGTAKTVKELRDKLKPKQTLTTK